ncbi:hypothetical protein [Virgibacillus sp. DJP39]|uniref:hypothetical protein n=1 Tax=Virgibacillus sp. DJP39 TaxID=3409790 RepID=UPI003BB78513
MGWLITVVVAVMYFYFNVNKSDEEDDYIPRYSGWWEDKGTLKNEIWQYNEPEYDTRYVQLIEN